MLIALKVLLFNPLGCAGAKSAKSSFISSNASAVVVAPGVQVLKYPSVYVVSVGVPKVPDAAEGAHSGFVAPVATVKTSPVFPIPNLVQLVPL